MMPKVLQAFIFSLLLRIVASAGLVKRSTEKHPITCHAGQFMVGSQGSVTCHLDKVSGLNAITVVQVPDSYEKGSERNALVCLESRDYGLHCEETDGFSRDSSLTTLRAERLTLTILNVTADFAGYYGCHSIPPTDDVSPQLCRLIVAGGTTREEGEEITTHSVTIPNEDIAINNTSTITNCHCLELLVIVPILPFIVTGFICWRSSLRQKIMDRCKCANYQRGEDVTALGLQHEHMIENGNAGIHMGH